MRHKFICKTFVKPYQKWIQGISFKKTGYIKPLYLTASIEPAYPSAAIPDHITLTPAADPAHAQTFNWRTNDQVTDGFVEIQALNTPNLPPQQETATYTALTLPELIHDVKNHYFHATAHNLKPDTLYRYRVGSMQHNAWSPYFEFITGPALKTKPFTFAYLGDFQTGFDSIEQMLQDIVNMHPQTAFFVHAGDFVNNGERRNEWDKFFAHTGNVFSSRFLAPTPGNHDYHDVDAIGPLIYVKNFNMPANGAPSLPANHSYSFIYGNAAFIMADTNLSIKLQTPWLKQQLKYAAANCKYITVVFHHPVFTSKKHRDKNKLLKKWVPLFDKYGVDLVLCGHDHGYMRSYQLRNGQIVNNGGTSYILATGGTQFYQMERGDFAAIKLPQTQTYQLIELNVCHEGRPALIYRAFNTRHELVDEFVLLK